MQRLTLTRLVGRLLAGTWLMAALWSTPTHPAQADEPRFYFGVDLSYVNEMDDCGAVYRENGAARDAFELFADHGANLVRARLWHDPDWTEYSTLADVERTFARATAAGMDTLLDFHYSDTWADPGRQQVPAAWESITATDALAAEVYRYTSSALQYLHAADLTPAFVQVGNEINPGLLKAGEVRNDWPRDARLINAGIRAVRDFAAETGTDPRIILHVAQPENTEWWFAQAEAHGVTDFDVIGVSYYPQWSTFSIAEMGAHAGYLRERFAKDVMIVETAYGWTRDAVTETADNILTQGVRGYPFSPEGQRRFMTDLTQSLISNGGLGIVYWEPAWVSTPCSTRWGQGSHWENATFFDFRNDNELLEGIDFLSHPYTVPAAPPDGVVEDRYGAPLVEDDRADVIDGIAALDLTGLYATADRDTIQLATTVAGDVYAAEGHFLYFFDTTHDDQGAGARAGRRPITAADPFKPEYRLELGINAGVGMAHSSITFYAWTNGDWEAVTFTGGIAVRADGGSVIEIALPRALLGETPQVHIAVVSTDRARAHSAGDILGTADVPANWTDDLVLDTFFALPAND